MNCIVVDDESLSREGLKGYIEKIPYLTLAEECENVLQASEALRKHNVDLIFLDIQMPYLSGIDFLKNLAAPPLVIFHTAFPNYAIESYQLDVIDYLVKPINFERFFKAVQKAKDYYDLKAGNVLPASQSFLFLKCDQRYEKIIFNEILYIESMQNYAVIYTNRKKYVVLISLKLIMEKLPKDRFLRIHKSYIVALDKISGVEGNAVYIANKCIPCGKQHKAKLYRYLGL